MNAELNGLRFAIYTRKSTESEDRQVQSIQDQISRLEELAQREGLTVVKTYRESKSAKSPRTRPQFNQLLEDIRSGEIDGILCWAVNRLARNNVDSSEIQWELQEGELKCIKTIEKNYLPEDSGILFTLESAMATEFIRDLRKNVMRGMQSKLDKGVFPALPPLGYRNCPHTRTIVPDEKYFPLVRKMWDLMLRGIYSPQQILHIVNEDWGFKSPVRKKMGGKPISLGTLYKMFHSEFYKGIIIWKGERYNGIHERMISSGEFERVQELIERKGKTSERKREFAYTGIIRCGDCGCLITAQEKKKVLKDGSANYHRYYHCTGKSKFKTCSQKKFIKVQNLEEQIEQKLQEIQIIPEFRELALEILKEKHQEEIQERVMIEDNLTDSIKSTQGSLDNLIDLRVRNLLTDDEFVSRKENLSSELDTLKKRRSEVEHRAQNWRKVAEQVFDFATFAVETFQNGSLKKKKEILLALGQNLELKDQKLTLRLNKWLEIIQDEKENLTAEFERLEPRKHCSAIVQNSLSRDVIPSWYSR